jgi:hypothetical protein
VGVIVEVAVSVAVDVGEVVGVLVGVRVAVRVGVEEGVRVAVELGVRVGLAEATAVGVTVAAEASQHSKPSVRMTPSMRQPTALTLLSLPRRQRNAMLCPATDEGRSTTVSMYPAELPLHALRPPMGLPEMVESEPV